MTDVNARFPPKFVSCLKKASSFDMCVPTREYWSAANLLKAKRVSLSVRPHNKYSDKNNDANKSTTIFDQKQFYLNGQTSDKSPKAVKIKKQIKPKVKSRIYKTPPIQRTVCPIPVKNLSVPTNYYDYSDETDFNVNKIINNDNSRANRQPLRLRAAPGHQVSRKLCHARNEGRETENRLLIQISEAKEVSDFERILNANSALSDGQSRKAVTRPVSTAPPSTRSHARRPRSNYSVSNVNETYNFLFQQHIDSVQDLIEKFGSKKEYRQEYRGTRNTSNDSILGNQWYEQLQDLSEYYDEDLTLREELRAISDQLIEAQVVVDEAVKIPVPSPPLIVNKNYNVNITIDLTSENSNTLDDSYEVITPLNSCDDSINSYCMQNLYDECKESMNDQKLNTQRNNNLQQTGECEVERLASSFQNVHLESNANIPTITFSSFCDRGIQCDSAVGSTSKPSLSIPPRDNDIKSRPPMM